MTDHKERFEIIIQKLRDSGHKITPQRMAIVTILSKSKGALHLRTLQNFNDISSDQSNTIVFAIPIETLGALEGIKK